MGRTRRVQRIENIEVIDLGDKGRAIGKAPDGRIVLVERAVPGDVITGRRVQKKKGMWIMVPDEFEARSEHRTEPFCTHFGTCGGCKWQNLQYEMQLHYKEKAVRDAIQRLAKVENPEILTIAGCADTRHYRNKLEFTFSDKKWLTREQIDSGEEVDRNGLGFHVPGAFDKVVDLSECFLQPQPSDRIRSWVRQYAADNDLTFQNIRERTGLLRNLVVRNNIKGELMIVVVFGEDDEEARRRLLDELAKAFPQIVSLYYCINTKVNDSTFDLEMHLHAGTAHMREQLGHVSFDIGPKSFFQTNPIQAKNLFDITAEMAAIGPSDKVFDLYCGIGSITLYVAETAAHVVGVEEVSEAIEDARRNAELNGIKNVDFFTGDVRHVMKQPEFSQHGKPDIIISDPPRAGMHESVVRSILDLEPKRVVYVSCNPSTQARDIALLGEKYQFVKARPVDMFPHTSHIENVALLTKK